MNRICTSNIRSLRFCSGDHWSFHCNHLPTPWLDEFAGVIGAAAGECTAPTGIVRIQPWDKASKAQQPTPPFTYRQGSAYRVRADDQCREILIELDPDFLDHPQLRYIYMSACLRPVIQHYVRHGRGCLVHAASCARGDEGVLIVADGGVGKSTCCRRLPAGWTAAADDMALALPDATGAYRIHPLPTWSDYLEQRCRSAVAVSTSYPLRMILFLEQADCDRLVAMPLLAATHRLHKICASLWRNHVDRLPVESVQDLAASVFRGCADLVRQTPPFVLRATLHGRFWEPVIAALDGSAAVPAGIGETASP